MTRFSKERFDTFFKKIKTNTQQFDNQFLIYFHNFKGFECYKENFRIFYQKYFLPFLCLKYVKINKNNQKDDFLLKMTREFIYNGSQLKFVPKLKINYLKN